MKNLRVIGIELAGGRYSYNTGMRIPGWKTAKLSDGTQINVGEDQCKGMTGLLDYVDSLKKDIDTSIFRKRLEAWVKTGTLPTEEELKEKN